MTAGGTGKGDSESEITACPEPSRSRLQVAVPVSVILQLQRAVVQTSSNGVLVRHFKLTLPVAFVSVAHWHRDTHLEK